MLLDPAPKSSTSLPQLVHFVDVDRIEPSRQRHHDPQSDDRFGRGDTDDEEREHLADHRVLLPGEPDEGYVDGIHHQLDRHQNDQHVAPRQHADEADDEEHRAQEEEVVGTKLAYHSERSPQAGCSMNSSPDLAITSSRSPASCLT